MNPQYTYAFIHFFPYMYRCISFKGESCNTRKTRTRKPDNLLKPLFCTAPKVEADSAKIQLFHILKDHG